MYTVCLAPREGSQGGKGGGERVVAGGEGTGADNGFRDVAGLDR